MYRRRWVCFGLIIVLLVSLAGCDTRQKDNLPVVVNIWTYYRGGQRKTFDAEIKNFNETLGKELNMIVEHKSFGNVDAINDNLISASRGDAGAHSMPDIFITYKGIGRTVNENYKLINFEDYYTADEINAYVDDFIEVGYIKEDNKKKLIMFPIAKSSDILLINDTEFSKFMKATDVTYEDLDEYEDLVKVAEKYYMYTDALTPQAGDGKALFGVDSVANYFLAALKQLGFDMLSTRSGKTVLNLSKVNARKIWDNYYVPVVKGYAGKQGNYVSEDIKVGKLILGLSYTTSASYFPKQTYIDEEVKQIELKVMHSPYMKGGQKLFINQGGGIFVVDSSERKNNASIAFVKWITEKDKNLAFTIRSSYFPISKATLTKEVITEYEEEHNIDDNIVQTLNVGINQFSAMKSYTPEALDGYEEVRIIIEKEFAQLAKKDAKDVKDRIKSGEHYKQALEYYLSDLYFEKWYDSFVEKINLTLESY